MFIYKQSKGMQALFKSNSIQVLYCMLNIKLVGTFKTTYETMMLFSGSKNLF